MDSVRGVLWAPAAVVFVLADDLLLSSREWPMPVLALLDEPAHLATAALLLASVGALRRMRPVLITLAASVAIDVDHLPLYAGAPMGAAGRPPTHSLLTVAALAGAGLLVKRRRGDLLACAAGVALHLVRDVATGPGVPLWWPLSPRAVQVPYAVYAAALAAGAAGVALHLVRDIATGPGVPLWWPLSGRAVGVPYAVYAAALVAAAAVIFTRKGEPVSARFVRD